MCVCAQLEAIPESLKNMLLVMDTAGIFHSADSRTGFSDLWEITWERIVCFLPNLREELFKQTVIAGTPPTQEHVSSQLLPALWIPGNFFCFFLLVFMTGAVLGVMNYTCVGDVVDLLPDDLLCHCC